MGDTNLVERYLMLNLLKKCPNSTKYLIREKMMKLQFSIPISTFYLLFNQLMKEGKIESYNSLYSVTPEGHRELFRLESKIKIALMGTIWGEKV